jgi:hypothetical protein
MNTLFWFLYQLFNLRKSEQEHLEWHWFWHIEMVAWWNDLAIVKSTQQCVHWTRARLWRKDEPSDDDIPF